MGWITDLLKEIPSAARYKSELEQMESENERLRHQVKVLESENSKLKQKVAELSPSGMTPYLGLLWNSLPSGSYEPNPYCPDCKSVLMGFPPEVNDMWLCGKCHRQFPYSKPPKG
jgi:hypothetical protein